LEIFSPYFFKKVLQKKEVIWYNKNCISRKERRKKVNQILATEKLYVTPELKRKRVIYKVEFFLSIFLICLLFSYYVYAEYDRSKTAEVSQEILAQLEYNREDTTVKKADNDVIVVVLNKEEEDKHNEERNTRPNIDTATYTSKDGVKYTTESVLKIPKIGIEYPVYFQKHRQIYYMYQLINIGDLSQMK